MCCTLDLQNREGVACTIIGVHGCRYVGLDWETEVVWSWGLPQRPSSTTVSPIRRGHSQHRGLCTGIQELCLLLDTEGRAHGERVVQHGWLPGMTRIGPFSLWLLSCHPLVRVGVPLWCKSSPTFVVYWLFVYSDLLVTKVTVQRNPSHPWNMDIL